MRDWSKVTVSLEPIPRARFLEDRWRWSVKIPAEMAEDGGLRRSGASPSGAEMTRAGALRSAQRAVLRQQEEDRVETKTGRWVPLDADWDI